MTHALPTLRSLGPAVLLLALTVEAQAHERTYTARTNLAPTPWTTRLEVPRFDPTFGQLTEVRVQVKGHVEGHLGLENQGPQATQAASTFSARIAVRSVVPCLVTPALAFQDALGPYDGQLDYQGASGMMHASLACDATSPPRVSANQSDLARFTGPGRVEFLVIAAANSEASSGSSQLVQASSEHARATVEVTYVYTLVLDCSAPDTTCGNIGTIGELAPSSASFGLVELGWMETGVPPLVLPKFVPAQGTCQRLIQADITVTGTIAGQLRVENLDALYMCTATLRALGQISVFPPTELVTSPPLEPLLPSQIRSILDETQSRILEPFDGVDDFDGPSGERVDFVGVRPKCYQVVDPVQLRNFQVNPDAPGQTTLVFTHSATDSSSSMGCAPQTFDSGLQGRIEVSVRYVYCESVPPDAVDDPFTLVGGPQSLNVFANDTVDMNAQPHCPDPIADASDLGPVLPLGAGEVMWVDDPVCTNGICNQRCVRFVPQQGSTWCTATFTYELRDRNGCSDTATVTVNRTRPVLNDDEVSLCKGSAVMLCPFANDSSDTPLICPQPGSTSGLGEVPAGWTVTWMSVGSCGAGANTCPGLSLQITPLATFTGTAMFSYTLSDADGCPDSALVTVNVFSPPVLNDDAANLCQGTETTICPFANDTSDTPLDCPPAGTMTGLSGVPPGWTVTWVTAASCGTGPANTCPNLGLRIVPLAAFTGTLSTITYSVSDTDGCEDSATVMVNVRTRPVLNNDTANLCQGTETTICPFANDSSDTPLVCPAPGSTTGITGIPAGWTVTWVTAATCGAGPPNTCPNLGLRILPAAAFTGTSSTITYTLPDTDGCTDSATVTVNVRTLPMFNNDTANTCQNTPININVFANDSSDTPVVCPPAGSMTGLSAVMPPGAGVFSWVMDPVCTNGICNLICLRFVPSASFTGSVTTTYTLSDTDTCSDNATVTVNVRTPPVLNNDTANLCQGTETTICPFANDSSDTPLVCPAPGSTTGITGIPPGWTVTWVTAASCGAGPVNTCPNLGLRILPAAAFTGTSSTITYTLSDTDTCPDNATVTVNVRTPPVFNNDMATLCQGTETTICPFANDASDTPLACPAPGSTTGITGIPAGWTVTWVTAASCGAGPANTCPNLGLRILPAAAFTGTLSTITYTLSDTDTCSDSATVTVRVDPPPNLMPDGATTCSLVPVIINVLENDDDGPPLDASTLFLVTQPAQGMAEVVMACAPNQQRCILYTPPKVSFSGVVGFTYEVAAMNGGCTSTADVSVNVTPGLMAVDDFAQTREGCPPVDVNFLVNDSSCGPLQCGNYDIGAVSPVGAGTVTLVSPGTCGVNPLCPTMPTCFRFTPAAGFTGTATFDYTIHSQGLASGTAIVTIQVLPDCNHNCIPDSQEPDADADGIPDDCEESPCTTDPMLQVPGSLLLYPEFDNRNAASKTLLTVTNVNEDLTNGTVVVEFIYLGRYNSQGATLDCQEFNRTATLTPGDTLTLLTNFHNPFQHQGYVYLFAKNVQGQPISFNHLIGNLVHLEGIQAFEWSVNAFAFGSPHAYLESTNDDGDAFRDLNGIEYAPVPDQIFIPRFLGQGAGSLGPIPSLDSALILIPLSGGTFFTSTIDFLIYNDNEQAYSAQVAVRCWDKPLLRNISGAFLNDFLQLGTNQNPAEIVGLQPAWEAGWFTMDGLVAFSSQDSIPDPAFLAVLVETATPYAPGTFRYVADLPFATSATQSNGDLLPRQAIEDDTP